MTNSSIGDSLDLSVGRSRSTEGGINISGWFDIKHTCFKTGKVADHSGPNCILSEGVLALINGLFPGEISARTITNLGIWISGVGTSFVAGALTGTGSPTVTTTTHNQTATPVGTGDDEFQPAAATTLLGDGSTTGENLNVFYRADGTDGVNIFTTNNQSYSIPTSTIISGQIDIVNGTSAGSTQQTVDSIFVCDVEGTNDASTILLAGRAGETGNANTQMAPVVMNNQDTLAITYTITLTAS
jgi:hypothetical protein